MIKPTPDILKENESLASIFYWVIAVPAVISIVGVVVACIVFA